MLTYQPRDTSVQKATVTMKMWKQFKVMPRTIIGGGVGLQLLTVVVSHAYDRITAVNIAVNQ